MASTAIAVTLGAAVDADGNWAATAGSTKTLDSTALAAAMAVLVADGAAPTQAHVTTANNALTAYLAAVSSNTGANLVLIVDTAVLTTSNKISSAVKAALQLLRNYGLLTI